MLLLFVFYVCFASHSGMLDEQDKSCTNHGMILIMILYISNLINSLVHALLFGPMEILNHMK